MIKIAPYKFLTLLVLIVGFVFICLAPKAYAGNRFTSSYPCSDSAKTCVSSGTRIVDGFEVHKDCWEWSYQKTCNYPSKDDCKDYSHCYLVADKECLLKDSLGNCVNLQKEFSCKSWQPVTIDKEMVRIGIAEQEGKEKLVCKGLHCIDGNCFDKSYMTDDDMMDSVSKLYAVSQMKDAKDLNFSLFAGFSQSCSKKAANYTNCCSSSLKFWGKNLGARCTKDEVDLIEKRQKNLCVYVGKENKQTMGVTTVVKHHYCCFGGLLNKIIQIEGRKQLGMSFGSGGKTDCRGLTLAEIMMLDFNKMDFSEFYAEILKRMKIPKAGDITARVSSSIPNIHKYDGNSNNKQNNRTGWNSDIKDDSWETQEERRLEGERLEQERLVILEQQKKETERLELEKKQKLIKEQEEKNKRRVIIEQQLVIAQKQYKQLVDYHYCQDHGVRMDGNTLTIYNSALYQEYLRSHQEMQRLHAEVRKIETNLKEGNY